MQPDRAHALPAGLIRYVELDLEGLVHANTRVDDDQLGDEIAGIAEIFARAALLCRNRVRVLFNRNTAADGSRVQQGANSSSAALVPANFQIMQGPEVHF
jgi:hypothetical protein